MVAVVLMFLSSALLAYFIVLCIKASVLIRRELGTLAAIVFVVGIFSCSSSGGSRPTQAKQWRWSEDSTAIPGNYQNEVLESNLMFKIKLAWLYGYKPGKSEPVAVSAMSTPTGFTSNVSWDPISISIAKTSSPFTFHYEVTGVLKWNLLRFPLWEERKTYRGESHIGGTD